MSWNASLQKHCNGGLAYLNFTGIQKKNSLTHESIKQN